MHVSTFLSSAVIGLAAVSVAMPMLQNRGIITIGDPNAPTNDPAASTTPTPSSASTAPTSTPTFNSGQWQAQQKEVEPNNGMWNKTKYDDSWKFNDGKWHPNQTESTTAKPKNGRPTGVHGGNQTSNGTEVSGGISWFHDPDGGDAPFCIFGLFCSDKKKR